MRGSLSARLRWLYVRLGNHRLFRPLPCRLHGNSPALEDIERRPRGPLLEQIDHPKVDLSGSNRLALRCL